MITPERFAEKLNTLEKEYPFIKYLVAYSGGLDSHVLLHLIAQTGKPVRAVYVNHGLQKEAAQWAEHCEAVCQSLNISFQSIPVDARPHHGESPEEAARNARYQAFEEIIDDDECLLTAHHMDDQAETFLLQLFRGAGPAGLSSMPVLKHGRYYHARPLLECSRIDLSAYARAKQLEWIEDPSNQSLDYDRNFLRHEMLPVLQKRWPDISYSISKSANFQQEALEIIQAMAEIDLAAMSQGRELDIKRLHTLSQARQRNALRTWIKKNTSDNPTGNILSIIISDVLHAEDDAEPLVSWSNTEVRRFKNLLYIMSASEHDASISYLWNVNEALELESIQARLSHKLLEQGGIDNKLLNETLSVTFRQGGERITLKGKQHSQSLKKLMQEAGIPPWQRSRIPLIYFKNELVHVCGYWTAAEYAAENNQPGWLPVLEYTD